MVVIMVVLGLLHRNDEQDGAPEPSGQVGSAPRLCRRRGDPQPLKRLCCLRVGLRVGLRVCLRVLGHQRVFNFYRMECLRRPSYYFRNSLPFFTFSVYARDGLLNTLVTCFISGPLGSWCDFPLVCY